MSAPDPKSEDKAEHVIEPLLVADANGGDGVQQDDHDGGGPIPNQRPERKISRGERKISRKTHVVVFTNRMRVSHSRPRPPKWQASLLKASINRCN